MKHEMTNKEYNEYVKTKTPNSKLFSNCLKAFVSGGIICVIGHFILTMFKKWGLDTEAASTATSIILVFAGALLTGLDIYPKIRRYGARCRCKNFHNRRSRYPLRYTCLVRCRYCVLDYKFVLK